MIEETTPEQRAKILAAVADSGPKGITPSEAARKAKVKHYAALRVLMGAAEMGEIRTTGNGAWTRYHKG